MPSKNLELFLVGRDLSASKAMAKLGHETEKAATLGSKFGQVMKVGLLAAAGAVVGAGAAVLHFTDNYERAHARLETAIRNTGNSSDAFKGKVAAADKTLARFAFTSTDTENALAVLTTATRSPTKALGDLQVAADLARLKNISLADAAEVVAKAQAGQLRGIRALGLDLPIAAGGAVKLQTANANLAKAQQAYNHLLDVDHGKKKITAADNYALAQASAKVHAAQLKVNAAQTAGDQIVGALAKAVKGQAAAAVDTLGGKLDVLKVRAENFAVKVGLVAIPAVLKFGSALGQAGHDAANAAKWIEKHKDEAIILAGVLTAALLPALGRLSVAFAVGAYEKFATGLLVAAGRADALVAAVNPVTAGLGLIAAAFAYGYLQNRKWNAEFKATIDAARSLRPYDAIAQSLQDLVVKGGKADNTVGQIWRDLTGGEDAANKASGVLETFNANVSNLQFTFGLTKNAAVLLGQATGNDLTAGMRVSDAAIADWMSKALFANDTTRRFAGSTLILSAYVQDYVRTADGAKNATNALALAYQYLNSQGKDAVVAQLRFKQTLSDDISEMHRSTTSLNQNTSAGRHNVQSISDLIDQAEAAGSALAAQETSTKGVTRATLDGVNKTNSLIASFERQYIAAGGSKRAFDRLLRSMNLLPSQVRTTIETPGLTAAQAAVDRLGRTLSYFTDKTWFFDVASRGGVNTPAGGVLLPQHRTSGGGSGSVRPSFQASSGAGITVHVNIANVAVGNARQIAQGLAPAINDELERLGRNGHRLARSS